MLHGGTAGQGKEQGMGMAPGRNGRCMRQGPPPPWLPPTQSPNQRALTGAVEPVRSVPGLQLFTTHPIMPSAVRMPSSSAGHCRSPTDDERWCRLLNRLTLSVPGLRHFMLSPRQPRSHGCSERLCLNELEGVKPSKKRRTRDRRGCRRLILPLLPSCDGWS